MSENNEVQTWLHQALALQQEGKLAEAETLYRQALNIEPNNPHAMHLLGVLAGHAGQRQVALTLIGQSLTLDPDNATFHNNYGEAWRQAGNMSQAISCWEKAIELRPDYQTARMNLGTALEAAGDLNAAAAQFRAVADRHSDNAISRDALARVLAAGGKFDEAIARWRQVIALVPNATTPHINAGAALAKNGRLDEALNLLDRAVQLAPASVEARRNRGMALLQSGRLLEGLVEFDWLWQNGPRLKPLRTFTQPAWDGAIMRGKTILLYCEHGFGDAIQFVRFVPEVLARGLKVVLECAPELLRLFKTIKGITVIATGAILPPFDVRCDLLQLPVALQISLHNLPTHVPYLLPYRATYDAFHADVARLAPRIKIGLRWAGNPAHANDANRSIPPAAFTTLLQRDDLLLFNLQTDLATAQWQQIPHKAKLIDWTSRIKDFADTAALVANLDLIISVDTALVHLASALGRRVWTLLPSSGTDWRWLLGRQDSPWYPRMQLFRQRQDESWDSVLSRVSQTLKTN